ADPPREVASQPPAHALPAGAVPGRLLRGGGPPSAGGVPGHAQVVPPAAPLAPPSLAGGARHLPRGPAAPQPQPVPLLRASGAGAPGHARRGVRLPGDPSRGRCHPGARRGQRALLRALDADAFRSPGAVCALGGAALRAGGAQLRLQPAGPRSRGAVCITPIKVAFVSSWSRSGSTLLDLLLGSLPDFWSAGEIRYLWDRGL